MMRFGELNASDVRLVAINEGQDIVMQGTVPHHDDAVVAIEISLNGVDFTKSKLAFVFERFRQVCAQLAVSDLCGHNCPVLCAG